MQTRLRNLPMPVLAVAAFLAFTAAGDARAQTPAPAQGFAGLNGQNSKKPIDIESDRLEVDDRAKIATFVGNVSATQGDFNLRCPLLEVTYENAPQAQPAPKDAAPKGKATSKPQKPAQPVQPASTDPAGDPISSGQIKIIHAKGGKVLFQSKKDGQEATGDDAIYTVKDQKIVMTGQEVVLVQKGNVVKGKKLTIDLATGRYFLDTNQRIQAVLKPEGAKPFANPITGKGSEPTSGQ